MMDEVRQPLLLAEDEDTDSDGSSSSVSRKLYSTISAAKPLLHAATCKNGKVVFKKLEGPPSDDGAEKVSEAGLTVYTRRWYVLVMFCLFNATQTAVWSTFGSIAATSEHAFGWNDGTIALLNNWGQICYVIACFVFSWMMDVKGLRAACVSSMFLVALGASVRCISVEPPTVTWTMHLGSILNGLGGPVTMAGPAVLSAVWFPTHERTTATAIGAIMSGLGNGVSFLLGPQIVPLPPANMSSSPLIESRTTVSSVTWTDQSSAVFSNNFTQQYSPDELYIEDQNRIEKERHAIQLLMYIEAAWSIGLFVIMVIYFPKKPPQPPCVSAALQRENFVDGLKQLKARPHFWILVAAYGVATGVNSCWITVLDVILKPFGITEQRAGWIGFYSVCGSIFMALAVARFADKVKRIHKWIVFVFYVICCVAYLIFSLACIEVIPSSTVLLYTTIIVGYVAITSAIPFLYELACELAYPVGEATSNGILTMVNNFTGIIFLLVLMIPNIGTMWTNWTQIGAVACCLPLLLALRERYNRLEVDERLPDMATINIEVVVPAPQDS
ncbi:disrupted in renal carcinoma protein 2 homolog [Pomacea canaliculata]|uniref:disrupted in renal carcinoma protein 2 homolog n=1 Tax=Pomacea canaliculata TaxID=400727 RepID=UPI000D728C5D|nr:disrupted in renal carcinoma protein 2 homolog [Pomacea canaliculata]XP_025082551.1 disrupted in renal carcinoma protein 2 homolog [Pomacea canaliculata]